MTSGKEENINSLCKKYFTPELCDEPVTESKMALQNKICQQMIILGRSVWKKRNYKELGNLDMISDPNGDADNGCMISSAMEDAIYEAIANSFNMWKKELPKLSYTAYFYKVLDTEFIKSVDEDIDHFGGIDASKEKVKQIYKIAKEYGKKIDNETSFRKIAELLEYNKEEIDKLIKYEFYDKYTVEESAFFDADEEFEYSVFDSCFKNWSSNEGAEQEKQMMSKELITTLFSAINDVYKLENEDNDFLSKVITFKILSCFDYKGIESSAKSSLNIEFFNNLKNELMALDFTNKQMVYDFFEGNFPLQKELERSQGSVNNKWKQFLKKLFDNKPQLKSNLLE